MRNLKRTLDRVTVRIREVVNVIGGQATGGLVNRGQEIAADGLTEDG